MNSVFVEDTARNNLSSWASDAVSRGRAVGAVINPFCSPYIGNSYKPSAARIVAEIQSVGGQVWFDPLTHGLQMPGVGDYRYYDRWNLWDGEKGVLLTRSARRDHIQRVFQLQDELGVPHLAPSALVSGASGQDVLAAVALFEDALEVDPDTRLALAGGRGLWGAGNELDALVGTLAQLGGSGWHLTAVRETDEMPPHCQVEEVAGACRTARSLSTFGPVHVSFGDLAALPTIAAGANSIGTGWDPRQRSCFYSSYEARSDGPSTGGGWFQRPTVQRLFGVVTRAEVERFFGQDARFAQFVFEGVLHPTGPKEAFTHHLNSLGWALDGMASSDHEQRFLWLRDHYRESLDHWARFAVLADAADRSDRWVAPLLAGLELYASDEGWA